jgi:hypothetical protein
MIYKRQKEYEKWISEIKEKIFLGIKNLVYKSRYGIDLEGK